MRKFKKVTSMFICMIMLVCVFPINATAATGSRSGSTRVGAYTATGTLNLTNTSALATTSYEKIADSLNTNMTISVRNTTTGLMSSVTVPAISLDTAYHFASKSAGSNEIFVTAASNHRISYGGTIGTIALSV